MDFGAVPNDDINDLKAFQMAIKASKKQNVELLIVPPGQYIISDEKAIKLQEEVMYGKEKTQEKLLQHIFSKEFQYTTALDFKGCKNLTVEAEGAELLINGWLEPISLFETENITINGLSIDYKRPPNSAGKIVAKDQNFIDVKFFDWCPISEDIYFPRAMIYDDSKDRFKNVIGLESKKGKLVAPQTLRFKIVSGNSSEVGNIFWSIHSFHFRPAIFIYKSFNTTLNDISIFSQPGMGIVGHLSENIIMNRLKVVPKFQNRYISTNTDATHFASNYGIIEFNNCEFQGQGDDATNVHNYYMTPIKSSKSNSLTIIPVKMDLHSQKPEVPRIGDTLAIIEKTSLKEVGEIYVNNILSVNAKDYKVNLEYKGQIPDKLNHYLIANKSALPMLIFRNSIIKAHRARSILCKTKKVLIEDNIFFGSTGTAIHIGAEGNWMEGMPSEDIVIRNNKFSYNGGGDGTIDQASAIAISVEAEINNLSGLHKRILIEDNAFSMGQASYIISVRNAEDVTIRNNSFFKPLNQILNIGFSKRVKVYQNQGLKDSANSSRPPELPILEF